MLIDEIAYQQWHRMLFARFLAENGLLMHPDGVAVTLDECAELAPEEGAADAWDLAARYASAMLPGLFPAGRAGRAGAPRSPKHRQTLERLLDGLPPPSSPPTTAWAGSTSSGRASEEGRVNASERRSAAATLAR